MANKSAQPLGVRLTEYTEKWLRAKAGKKRGQISKLIEAALVEMRMGQEWKPPRKKRGTNQCPKE